MKNLIINIKILRLKIKKFLSKIHIYTKLLNTGITPYRTEKGIFVYYFKNKFKLKSWPEKKEIKHTQIKHLIQIKRTIKRILKLYTGNLQKYIKMS